MVSRERILLTVHKGALAPLDDYSVELLRERGFKLGDVLEADLRKARNPQFNRFVHAFGRLIADNIDGFEGLDAHKVIKRLQIEGNVACDEIALNFPGVGPCSYRVAKSLSFGSMDEGEFKEFYKALCRHVSNVYWPGLSPEQIEDMAAMMPDAP